MKKTIFQTVPLFIAVLLLAASAGWVGDSALELIRHGITDATIHPEWDTLLAIFTIGLIAMIWAFQYIYRHGRDYLPTRTLSSGATATPHKVLLYFVSPPLRDNASFDDQTGWLVNDHRLNTLTLDEAIKKSRRWNGAQLLRSVNHHKEELERVYLFGSQGNRGSHQHLEKIHRLLAPYIRPEVAVTNHPQALNFEDVDALHGAIISAVRSLEKEGYKHSDIMIDITGGQKTTSIAGALATVHMQDLEFEYVQTFYIDEDGPDDESNKEVKVLAFNCITVSQSDVG